MMKKLLSAITSIAVLTGITTLPASSLDYEVEFILDRMNSVQRADFETVVTYLGYATVEAFICETLAMRSSAVDSSRIKDLSGDDAADTADAICLMQFLEGMLQYPNDYRDLDVTGDCLIDENDPTEYLRYYVRYMNQGIDAPFSATNGTRIVDASYEYRTYVKCTYPACTTSEYTLSLNSETTNTSNASLNELSAFDALQEEEVESASTATVYEWSQTCDTRVVRIGEVLNGTKTYQSTGFIVGDHVIATSAHCVYNYTADMFNPYRTVWAYTYSEANGEVSVSEQTLTVESVHIPKTYYTGTQAVDHAYYDYALIVVEEDLSGYGCFDLGVITEDAICSEQNEDGTAFPLTVLQFRGSDHADNPTLTSTTPLYYDGWLRSLDAYRFIVRPNVGGVSGSAVYATESDNTITGIINATGTSGLAITRPLLHFFLNNSYL